MWEGQRGANIRRRGAAPESWATSSCPSRKAGTRVLQPRDLRRGPKASGGDRQPDLALLNPEQRPPVSPAPEPGTCNKRMFFKVTESVVICYAATDTRAETADPLSGRPPQPQPQPEPEPPPRARGLSPPPGAASWRLDGRSRRNTHPLFMWK